MGRASLNRPEAVHTRCPHPPAAGRHPHLPDPRRLTHLKAGIRRWGRPLRRRRSNSGHHLDPTLPRGPTAALPAGKELKNQRLRRSRRAMETPATSEAWRALPPGPTPEPVLQTWNRGRGVGVGRCGSFSCANLTAAVVDYCNSKEKLLKGKERAPLPCCPHSGTAERSKFTYKIGLGAYFLSVTHEMHTPLLS